MSYDVISLLPRAVEEFGTRVRAVGDDQWGLATPDADWDVRALVNHLVYEERWAVPLLEGRTLDEVGDRFDGDLLGADPKATWAEAARAAVDAAGWDGVAERTVHVSFGTLSATDYLAQLASDHVVHAWDLARAIGADEGLDAELVDFALDTFGPQVAQAREAGVFGPEVEAAPGASRQVQLLALTGRSA